MAEVDTSIYPKAAAPSNPLTMLGQFAGAQNALNVNKLFQSEFAARTGLGQAAQGAIDPATGEFDPGAYTRAVGANPDTAFKAPEAATQALAIQQQQIANRRANLELGIKHLDVIQTGLGSLLADPKSTPKDAADLLSRYVAFASDPKHPEGGTIMDAHMAAKTLESIPKAAYDDPAVFQQWLLSNYASAKGRQGELQAALPNAQPFNLGDRAVFLDRNPITNRTLTGTTATMGVPPVDQVGAADLGVDANGVPRSGTLGQRLNKLGVGMPQGSITPPGLPVRPQSLPGNMAPGNALGAVAPPPAPAPAAMPSPAPARAAGGAVPMAAAPGAGNVTGLPTGLKPGETAAANVAGPVSAGLAGALTTAADSVPQRRALLQNLENDIDKFAAGGPGAGWVNSAKAAANRISPFGNIFDPKTIASQEEFNKQATQLAQQQFAALGGTGTDSKLNSAMHTSPSEYLSNLGNKGIIRLLKANEDAIEVKNRAWQEARAGGLGDRDYDKFSTAFNKSFDPRVFQSAYMTHKEFGDFVKSIKDTKERAAFAKNYNNAVANGWIEDATNGGK